MSINYYITNFKILKIKYNYNINYIIIKCIFVLSKYDGDNC